VFDNTVIIFYEESVVNKLIFLASFAYLASGIILWLRTRQYLTIVPKTLILAVSGGAIVIHGMLLWSTLLDSQGILMGLGVSLSLAGWLSAVLIVMSSLSKPVETLGMFIFPISMLTLWLPAWLPVPHLMDFSIGVHVMTSLVAYTLLGLAAAQALLILIQEKRLKLKQWNGVLGSLPPLIDMEKTHLEWLMAGFFMLSLALVTGLLYVEDLFAQHLAHKTLFSLLSWLLVASLLIGRWRLGWRGQKAAKLSLIGYGLLVIGFAGSQFVLEVLITQPAP
jgi:ABC-type uncharacterized transport system permease subunit